MQCPKCEGNMSIKNYGAKISVYCCDNCAGLFCRPEALTEMLKEWRADSFLDRGSAREGQKYNKINEIDCPECAVRMDKIFDQKQSHIWLEKCPQCESTFLDAGEFTDLKNVTFVDLIRDVVSGFKH